MSKADSNFSGKGWLGKLDAISPSVRIAAIAGIGALGVSSLAIFDREAAHDAHDAVSSQLNLARDSQIYAQLVHKAIHEQDLAELKRLTQVYMNETDIDAIAVYGPGGESWLAVGEYAVFDSDSAVQKLIAEGSGSINQAGRVTTVWPTTHDGAREALIVLRSHATYGIENLREGLWRPLAQSGVAALLIALLVFISTKRITAPIDSLSRTLKHIKPGDADEALEELSSVDPEMSENFAAMVGRYEAAIFTHRRAAVTDPATGLMNRNHFLRLIDETIRQHGERAVVLGLIDVNRFRRINDQLGVKRADEMLLQIGQRLRENAELADRTLRPDLHGGAPIQIGRLSGVQFAVIIPMADDGLARDVLNTIIGGFAYPFEVGGRHVDIAVTSSAASAPRDAQTSSDLVKQAETALEHAKLERMTTPFFYNKAMAEEASARLRIEEEVRKGVDNGEFIAVFQPKVDLETGRVTGAEALARWRRPDGSVVSPGRFIPIAEELGLISRLGVSVLRDACMEAAKWHRAGENVRIAVNVSPHQFEDPDFIPAIYDSLEESGLPPDMLELEITESVAVEDPERVARVMRPLRSRGVRLAIDDFGTGHSNFTTLTRLPFDVFKIDQQFVRALKQDPHAPAIIEMILAMAEALNLETVAEGVETTEQFDFLKLRACTLGQGYFFSPPLPGHEFSTFLRHWKSHPGGARLSGVA